MSTAVEFWISGSTSRITWYCVRYFVTSRSRQCVVDELRLDAEPDGLITVDATVRVAPPVC